MKKNKKTSKSKRKKDSNYMAIILASVILVEGLLLGASASASSESAVKVLDLSSAYHATAGDLETVFMPFMDQFKNVEAFYNLAATEMINLLDTNESDIFLFPKGVFEFYRLASLEMEEMLDVTRTALWANGSGEVAGASVFK